MSDSSIRADERLAGSDLGAYLSSVRKAVRAAPDDVAPLLPLLQLSAWNSLSVEARAEVVELFAATLKARGRPMTSLGVDGFGPEGEQPVARFFEEATELVYALVPGGTFAPGLSEEEFAYLVEEGEFYGAEGAPRQADSVEVAPFLMSVAPIRESFAGLPPFAFGEGEGSPDEFCPSSLDARDIRAALKSVSADLPTTHQLEWAGRGGRRFLFPWGNESYGFEKQTSKGPGALDMFSFPRDPSYVAAWPYANPFGLLALGGVPVWCRSPRGGEHRTWGGAGTLYPWQGCGEWNLAACPLSMSSEGADGVGLRPVLPIDPRPSE